MARTYLLLSWCGLNTWICTKSPDIIWNSDLKNWWYKAELCKVMVSHQKLWAWCCQCMMASLSCCYWDIGLTNFYSMFIIKAIKLAVLSKKNCIFSQISKKHQLRCENLDDLLMLLNFEVWWIALIELGALGQNCNLTQNFIAWTSWSYLVSKVTYWYSTSNVCVILLWWQSSTYWPFKKFTTFIPKHVIYWDFMQLLCWRSIIIDGSSISIARFIRSSIFGCSVVSLPEQSPVRSL